MTDKRASGNRAVQVLVASLVVLALIFAVLVNYSYRSGPSGTAVGLGQLYRLADAGQIRAATFLDEDAEMIGTVCASALARGGTIRPRTDGRPTRAACPGARARFHTTYPRSDVATATLIERVAETSPVVVDKQPAKAVAKVVVNFVLPLLVLANLFALIFMARGGGSPLAQITGFGRIGRRRPGGQGAGPGTGVSFADVAGAEEAVTELREVTDYLRDPSRYQAFGAAPPKGVLLFGPPGCGKTLLARAVAGESGVPFFSISGAEFVESLVGVGAARVRDLFRQVREVAPAIVFIDEIDAVGRRREGEGFSGGEREQTVNQLLVELDGFEAAAGIVLMGATNRPDILDPALLRPGRFDRHVTLDAPNVMGREAILRLHAKGKPISPEVNFEAIARRTPGFTGADLANVINEATLLLIREGDEGTQIRESHLSEAVSRVLHGPQRRGRIMTAEERKRIAHHESGHALVAVALGMYSEASRVSVVARGRGLGSSTMDDGSERVLRTVTELSAELAVALAGIAAEELSFGEASTSAEDDVDRASAIATEMAGRYGLAPGIGRRRLLTKNDGYLGGGTSLEAVSGPTMAAFDEEVGRLLAEAEARAGEILAHHRDLLTTMADRLEVEETLEGPALEALTAPARPELSSFVFGASTSRGDNGTPPRQPARRR
ncbi:MAG TPA: AAA family ATPase [Acidimicrobiales bacterium]|nr:AAA family ATPase [Acidimicrobiales bacterium]